MTPKDRDVVTRRKCGPRVAKIVAARLRDDILSGRPDQGDVLPSQENADHVGGLSARLSTDGHRVTDKESTR